MTALPQTIEEFEQENSALAADQCHHGYGDEWGNHRCRYQDEIAALKAEIARLSKSPWRLIENHEPPKDRPILFCNLDDGISAVAQWEKSASLWRDTGLSWWAAGYFTHWCEVPAPLDQRPAPPAEGEKEGGK